MTAEEMIKTMQTILRDERDAIRRLDAAAVGRATSAKETLLKDFRATPEGDRADLAAALREIKPDLQRNLILLTHARDCLRDVIDTCHTTRRGRLDAKL